MKDRASASPLPPLHSVSILIDEMVLEEQASHFKHSNSVGGLCWLHTTSFQLVLRSYQLALFLAQGIGLGTFHLAKEVTVTAVSLFSESRSYPILAAPTCKKETADDAMSQMQLIIDAFNRIARGTVGAIWSFATNGDAIRRAASYTMFVKTALSEDSPLWNILGVLGKLGFNLFTGDFDITLDFDFKHLLKHMLVDTFTFNSRLPYHTPESVQQLLYPSDAQNVPCAIDLFMSIIDLRNLPCISDDPSEIDTMDALKLLAEILESLLDPFFNPEHSLQEQVTSLTKYSHLTDSQTMVKNAYFCIATQQLLDGKSSFYLFDLGDDKLEKLFGRIHMLGGHCSGMNYCQAIERLGQATDIDAVFEREPDWDPGFQRLKMTRTAHPDHLNAKAWKGDPHGGDKYPGVDNSVPNRSMDQSVPSSAIDSEISPSPAADTTLLDDDFMLFEDGLEEPEQLLLPAGPGVDLDDFIFHEGKHIHKQTLCRIMRPRSPFFQLIIAL
ncbi:hypothetical protein C8J56DRAFT_900688 [Mycena floridula]|nr:hypothetical protein C8J56DRAFT_900688 [Mycena floridula]